MELYLSERMATWIGQTVAERLKMPRGGKKPNENIFSDRPQWLGQGIKKVRIRWRNCPRRAN